MFDEVLEHQITFKMFGLNEDVKVEGNEIESLSAVGDYKNVIGDYILRPKRTYAFSFRIVNGLTCKIGIVAREFVEESKRAGKYIAGAFSDHSAGFSLFSNGTKRNGSSTLKGNKITSSFQPGDLVTMKLDSKAGSLSCFINNEFMGVLFLEEQFTQKEFYPAVAIIGDHEKIRHTFF